MLLAIDTATASVTVALHDGVNVIAGGSASGAQAHGEQLAPTIASVLSDAGVAPMQLTAIVCGVGPGPFTGLRVGIVTARVMAHSLGITAHGVCSLDVMAQTALDDVVEDDMSLFTSGFLVASDARRREVYAATYDSAGRRMSEPVVAKASELLPSWRALHAVGAGAALYAESFASVGGPLVPTPNSLGRCAARAMAGHRLVSTEPMYLRRPDVHGHPATKAVTPR